MIKRVILTTLLIFACGLFSAGGQPVWAHSTHEALSPFSENVVLNKHCPLDHHLQTTIICPHLNGKRNGDGIPRIARECGGAPDSPVVAFTGFQHNPMLDEAVELCQNRNPAKPIFIALRIYQSPSFDSPQHPPKNI